MKEKADVEIKTEDPDEVAAAAVAAGVKREREEGGGGGSSKQVKAESKVEPRCVVSDPTRSDLGSCAVPKTTRVQYNLCTLSAGGANPSVVTLQPLQPTFALCLCCCMCVYACQHA